jgi:hypothetical protein
MPKWAVKPCSKKPSASYGRTAFFNMAIGERWAWRGARLMKNWMQQEIAAVQHIPGGMAGLTTGEAIQER